MIEITDTDQMRAITATDALNGSEHVLYLRYLIDPGFRTVSNPQSAVKMSDLSEIASQPSTLVEVASYSALGRQSMRKHYIAEPISEIRAAFQKLSLTVPAQYVTKKKNLPEQLKPAKTPVMALVTSTLQYLKSFKPF